MSDGLRVDSVRKHFGTRTILNDVFISCKKGEIVGLFGRNGSGKSSLLKIISGILSAEFKYVTIDGQRADNSLYKRGVIRYLPSVPFLPGHLMIKDVISSFCVSSMVPFVFEIDAIRPMLYKKSKQLSGGESRMVEILIMLYSGAEYLLFDEPFNGIEPIYIEKVKELIQSHSKEKGFIIIDHDYRNVLDISTSTILLKDGATKRVKDVQELAALGYLPSRG